MSSISPTGSSSVQSSLETEGSSFSSSTSNIQDSLDQTSALNESLTFLSSTQPALATPRYLSISEFFTAIKDTTLSFKRQLTAAVFTDQETRRILSQSAAIMSLRLGSQYRDLSIALDTINQQSLDETQTLRHTTSDIEDDVSEINNRISDLNSGNADESQESQDLLDAYDTYIQTIINLGGIDNGDGTYTLPEGATQAETDAILDQYNQAASLYQAQVDAFNDYREDRSNEISDYNQAVNQYNQIGSQRNQTLNQIIADYDLSDEIENNGIPSMLQPTALPQDATHNYQYTDSPDFPLTTLPSTIDGAAPPSWVTDTAANVPTVSSLSYTKPTDQQIDLLGNAIYQDLYNDYVLSLQTNVNIDVRRWAYLNLMRIFSPLQDYTPDPLGDLLPIYKRILPPSTIDLTKPVKEEVKTGSGALTTQTVGLGSPHFDRILNKAAAAQILNILRVRQSQVPSDQEVQALEDRFAALNLSLLELNSLESLLPSLEPVVNSLASLPPESALFPILFGTSFLNRSRELVQANVTENLVQNFINQTPELASLSPADQSVLLEQLSALANLNLLLSSTRLLFNQLGLNELLPSILPSITTPAIANQVNQAANTDNQQNVSNLTSTIQQSFVAQGFNPKEASFLANFGARLATNGVTTPVLPTINQDAIQTDTLRDSLTAALILADRSIPLTSAEQIATQAVSQTLANGSFSSVNQFTESLEENLTNLGIGRQSPDIALQVLILPRQLVGPNARTAGEASPVEALISAIENQPLVAAANTNVAQPQPAPVIDGNRTLIPENELVDIIQQRAIQFLLPQLGLDLARQTSVEIAEALFGTPDARGKAELKAPLSLVSMIKEQLYRLREQDNVDNTDRVADSFKEFIKENVRLDVFLQKLMEPQNLVLFSASPIIYGGHEPAKWKKSIDILI